MKLAEASRLCIATCLLVSIGAAQRAQLAGDRVEICYDAHMIPHVFGTSDEATFYGLGFHHMREFPIGTLNMLWLNSGRMAEIAGESYLDEDSRTLLWEVPKIARRHRAELRQARLLPLIRAYVAGIEAGRAWWRGNGHPSASPRLDALLGTSLEMNVDRVPDYLNLAHSPFGAHDDPDVPVQIRNVVNRMFAVDMPVTVDHVLRLGVAINSFFLLRSNEVPLDVMGGGKLRPSEDPRPLVDGEESKASNGWMVGPGRTVDGFPLTHSDGHIALNRLHLRPYMIQLRGSRYRATGLTMPGYPALYSGFSDHVSWMTTAIAGPPVVRNTWRITLEDDPDSTDLKFRFDASSGTELVFLEQEQDILSYFDPSTGTVEQAFHTRTYVPLHPDENASLGFGRYPVVSGIPAEATADREVDFQQAAFAVEGSPWELMLRMGRARNATSDVDTILDQGLFIVGDGVNLLVADTHGNFRYFYMARVPIQGAGVPASEYDEDAVLDGSQLSWRWQGFHDVDEVPRIGPVDVSGLAEVWICNNATPDRVEPFRFQEADLESYPAYMLSQATFSTWRQERAAELLRLAPGAISRDYNEVSACDRADAWMHAMWPLYRAVTGLPGVEVSVDALNLIAWVDEHRSHDEFDQPNARYDFVAHEFSQVQVYATLLRSHYRDRLDGSPGATAEQLALGEDPLHPLLSDTGQLASASYAPNVDALLHALETVAPLWTAGTGQQGLQNQEFLAGLSPLLPGDPWSDPRYDADVAPGWQGIIAGTKVTRWGHVNVLSQTPHYLVPPKRNFVEAAAGAGRDPLEILRGYLFSALDPPGLQGLPFENLMLAFHDQEVAVRPLGGVRNSLFFTQHKRVFEGPRPRGHQESVYRWDLDGFFYYHPQSSGSQTLFTVELARTPDAEARPVGRGRFLQTFGATEITRPDLLGNGALAYQRRFAPSQDFAAGQWNDILTSRDQLGPPRHRLFYREMGTTSRRIDLRRSTNGPFGD